MEQKSDGISLNDLRLTKFKNGLTLASGVRSQDHFALGWWEGSPWEGEQWGFWVLASLGVHNVFCALSVYVILK